MQRNITMYLIILSVFLVFSFFLLKEYTIFILMPFELLQTHKQPVTEYEAIREKAASQKRDIERALTKFLAKTSETHNLFNVEDNQIFPREYQNI